MQCCPNCGTALKRYESHTFGNVTINEIGDIVFGGRVVNLTATLRLLVEALIRAGGRPMTREALLNVTGSEEANDRTVDTYVVRARRAFQAIDPDFDQIPSARLIGYRWDHRPAVSLALAA